VIAAALWDFPKINRQQRIFVITVVFLANSSEIGQVRSLEDFANRGFGPVQFGNQRAQVDIEHAKAAGRRTQASIGRRRPATDHKAAAAIRVCISRIAAAGLQRNQAMGSELSRWEPLIVNRQRAYLEKPSRRVPKTQQRIALRISTPSGQ
jgi:hypothetical protein